MLLIASSDMSAISTKAAPFAANHITENQDIVLEDRLPAKKKVLLVFLITNG
jgi:hypothetical protein